MQTRTSGETGARARRHRFLATTALISLALLPAVPRSADAACNVTGSGTIGALNSGDSATCTGLGNAVSVQTATGQNNVTVTIGNGTTPTSLTLPAATSPIFFDSATASSVTVTNQASIQAPDQGINISDGSNNVVTIQAGGSIEVTGVGAAAISIQNSNGNTITIGGSATGNGVATTALSISGTSTGNVVNILSGGAMTGNAGTLVMTGAGDNTVNNAGTITDVGGVALFGSNGIDTIINSGTITSVSDAIQLNDGNDSLTLAPGSSITGFVIAGTGTDTLGFGGTGTASFDLGLLGLPGSGLQYSEFEQLEKTGTSTWTLTGTTTYNGPMTVTSGTLLVNGTLSSVVTVNGGILGGSGQVDGIVVNAGGTIAPGNSIGTTTVSNNVTFNAGSTYTVELNDGGNAAGTNNDHINATGTVTINGGTVHVTPENGTDTGTTYAVGTVYTVITAAGGVTGAFTSLTDNYAYLDFTLSYDPNNAYLTSQLAATSFCLPGMTGNQCAAGSGAFSLGAGTLYTAVLNLSNAEAPGALNQLSGEIHSSAKTALIEDSHFVRDAALNRIRSAFESVAASSTPIFSYAPGGLQPAPASTDRFAIWGQAFGAFGHINSNGNAAKLDRSSGGLFIGGDGQVTDHWRVGAFGGYSRSKFDADERRSSGSSDNYHAGIYGGNEWGAFGLRYGGAYTWHNIDIARSIAFTGFSDHLAADYGAGTAQVFGEAGYQLRAGSVRYEPFANLAYVNLHTDGFRETGGAAALVASGRSTDATFTTLGLRAETTLVAGQSQATLRGMLGWRHAFGDVVPTSTMTFAAGGSAFAIAGVPIAQDALVLDAGFDVKLTPAAVLGFAYGGQFGSGVTDQSLKANLSVRY